MTRRMVLFRGVENGNGPSVGCCGCLFKSAFRLEVAVSHDLYFLTFDVVTMHDSLIRSDDDKRKLHVNFLFVCTTELRNARSLESLTCKSR